MVNCLHIAKSIDQVHEDTSQSHLLVEHAVCSWVGEEHSRPWDNNTMCVISREKCNVQMGEAYHLH